jgi:predicted ATPase
MKLKSLEIKGFKSISPEGQRIPLGDVTVLLGANGSGKSNLLSFFRLLNALATDKLYYHTQYYGAENLLYFGGRETPNISFSLSLENHNSSETYQATLSSTTNESLFLNDEALPSPEVSDFLSKIKVYQFYDTTDTSPMKRRCYIDDAYSLRTDGGNIAPVLYQLKHRFPEHYKRILLYVQKVMPQFGDFHLELLLNSEDVKLDWTDPQGQYVFKPSQLSDGTLRFIGLATLLLLPKEMLPPLIVIDEPELGLHPTAISVLASLVRSVSFTSQVLLATQSASLVNEFSPGQIIVTEQDKEKKCSIYKQLDSADLEGWIDRYSLAELWEKNVLGGKP